MRLLLALLLQPRAAQGWTTLAQNVWPGDVVALLEGERIGPLGSFYAGFGYLWPAPDLRDLTWAVSDELCAGGWPLPVAGNGTCEEAVTGVVKLAFEQLGLTNYVRHVGAECRARSGSGRVETQTCSSEAGGPAKVVVALAPDDAAAMRAPPLQPRAELDEQVLTVSLTTLAVCYVFAAPSTTWEGTRGAKPRYADGSPHSMLATSAAVIELSRSSDILWCAADAEDAAAGACNAHAEAQATDCVEPLKVVIHELGHGAPRLPARRGHPVTAVVASRALQRSASAIRSRRRTFIPRT